MKNPVIIIIAIVSIFVSGCGKKPEQTKGDQTNYSSGNPITAPVDYLGAVGKAKQSADKTLDIVQIQRAIQQFEAAEGRFPKDLEELVAQQYLAKIPKAPPGMRIVYDPQKGTVKVVPAQ